MNPDETHEIPQEEPTPTNNRGWANLRKLAQQHTEQAVHKAAELLNAENTCVAVAAVKLLLERGHGRVAPGVHRRAKGESGNGQVNVTIRRFDEGIIYDKRNRDQELPVVYGGWQGPRNLGDGGDTGLLALRGKRPGVCDEPGIHDRAAQGLQGPGSARGHRGGTAAAGTHGSAATAKKRRRKK